jgi:hypothetical protein
MLTLGGSLATFGPDCYFTVAFGALLHLDSNTEAPLADFLLSDLFWVFLR